MDHNMDFGVNFGQDGSPEKKNVPPGFSELKNATQDFLSNELGGGFSQLQQKAQENVHNIFSHDLDDDFRDITSQSHPLDDHHMKQSHGDEDFEHDSLNFLPSSTAHKDNANENVKVISSKDLLDDFDVFSSNKKQEAEKNVNQFISDKSDLLANVGEQIKSNIKDNVDKTNQFMDDFVGLTSTKSSNQNDTPKHIASDIKKDLFDDFGFDAKPMSAQKPSAPEPKQFSDDEFFNSSTGSSPAKSKITTKNTSDNDKFISNESLENLRSKVEDIKEKAVEDIKDIKSDIKAKIQPPKQNIMQGEVIFHKPGDNPGHYKTSINIHPLLESLIYWRDIKVSAVVFTIGLILLLALTLFSVISVIAYTSLIILTTSIGFRIYKYVMAMVAGDSSSANETENPFEKYLNADIDISQERTKQLVGVTVASLNAFASELKKLFLVEDYVESIKFGIILWILTYIGSWFNGMTLIILAYILLFTIPIVYEHNKPLIDQNMEFARAKVSELQDKIMAILPFAKPPGETEKNK